MAKCIMNARVYLAEVDLSGVTNAAALNVKVDLKDCPTCTDDWITRLPGIKDVICDVKGWFDADPVTGQPAQKMFDSFGLSSGVLSLAAGSGALGDKAWFFRPTLAKYDPLGGKVGEVVPFELHAEGGVPLVKGQVLQPKNTLTISGNGSALQLGALSATQKIYCGLHVFAVSGGSPTLNVILQADNASNFPSPATQITFAQKVAVGQDWQSANGPVTDDWWRINYTIGGSTPSFTFALVAGIV